MKNTLEGEEYLRERTILTYLNNIVNEINNYIFGMIEGLSN